MSTPAKALLCKFPGCRETLPRAGYCVTHRNPLWRMQHDLNPSTHAPRNGPLRRPLKSS